MVLGNLIFQAEVVEQRFRAVVLPHHDQQASDDRNQTEHGRMLSSNMLLRNLILLIDVTFSTPTGVSDNVGGVKHVATTLPHALEQERHFALIGEVLNPTKARFLISIQVGKLSSTHASLRSQARS